MADNIEPCPFCAGEALLGGIVGGNYIIKCRLCAVVMTHDRRDKVIQYWNTRMVKFTRKSLPGDVELLDDTKKMLRNLK